MRRFPEPGKASTANRPAAKGGIGTVLLVLVFCVSLAGCNGGKKEMAPPARPRMSQAVYVWQREWNDDVRSAVSLAAGQVDEFVVLAAEATLTRDRPAVAMASVDFSFLKTVPKPTGLAIRIGEHAGDFRQDERSVSLLVSLASECLAKAKAAGLHVAELQIDFDCAESRLEDYTFLVKTIKRMISPMPLVVTALPCWLNDPHFPELATTSDGFVLQVHSLERPRAPGVVTTLCDPEKAKAWIRDAGRFGAPFRVALPTYGYLAAFSEDGKLLGISAEGPARAWNEKARFSSMRSNPRDMGDLAQSWSRDRPRQMKGLLWYRLPVQSDRLNWKWETLSAILSGKSPATRVVLRVEYAEPLLAEVALRNEGLTDFEPEEPVALEWDAARLIGGDALHGYEMERLGDNSARLKPADGLPADTLRPGETWKIAWLRFDRKTEVKADASTP